ncbi:MAG TPA: imidazole glycerol phosphate synthase subunit HisH [Magnetospirillaceae bacterium]|jgi:glutamine amidotransferase
MSVVVIDYGSGNLRSAAKAFERVVAETGLNETVTVTADADLVRRADRIVLPGVGAFADCRRGLYAVAGMVDAMTEAVIKGGKPMIGICVGMQLLAEWGREYGDHPGLGWIPGEVVELTPSDPGLKIPHMGWNTLELKNAGYPVLAGIEPGQHAYFVHSYHFRASNPAHVLATTDYGGPVSAVLGRDNIVGTQFHPEKSQKTGLTLISNFLKWKP